MVNVQINGEQKLVEVSTLQELVVELGLTNKRIAVELNLEIIPKGLFSQTLLVEGDRVEIVQAIGGG